MTDTLLRKDYQDYVLPSSVVTKLDISRLVSEVEKIDNEITTAAVRAKVGASSQNNLVLSEQLTELLNMNQLRATNSQERTELIKKLRLLKDNIRVVHMTFAVEADRQTLQELVAWLRQSIHPQVVIEAGLQPGLVAGVYMRTPNHIHDMSLRSQVQAGHESLVKQLEALRGNS